jgi:hypothetical protein
VAVSPIKGSSVRLTYYFLAGTAVETDGAAGLAVVAFASFFASTFLAGSAAIAPKDIRPTIVAAINDFIVLLQFTKVKESIYCA